MKHFIARSERRVSIDRRNFSYAAYIPERRSGTDRRDIKLTQTNQKVACA
jgi:hypothetical protein